MEEDLEVLENIINALKGETHYLLYTNNKKAQAIEHLIARNKELEEKNTDLLLKLEMKKVLFVRKDKTTNKLLSELYIRKDELEKDYIPKSKVIEIIENYYNEHGDTKEEITKFIEQLLQEGDK